MKQLLTNMHWISNQKSPSGAFIPHFYPEPSSLNGSAWPQRHTPLALTCRLRGPELPAFWPFCARCPRAWANSSSNSRCRLANAGSEQPGKNQSSSISFVPQEGGLITFVPKNERKGNWRMKGNDWWWRTVPGGVRLRANEELQTGNMHACTHTHVFLNISSSHKAVHHQKAVQEDTHRLSARPTAV